MNKYFQMNFSYFSKPESKAAFRSLFKADEVKVCEFLNGTEHNSIAKALFQRAGKKLLRYLHRCPLEVGSLKLNLF